jgi:hypothetical protein
MTKRAWLTALLLLWPVLAHAAPSAAKLVDQAVIALSKQCYRAQMRFISPNSPQDIQEAMFYHVAPDLYCVQPLINGQPSDIEYIENAEECVRRYKKAKVIEVMPSRQFCVNDQLTKKFLRDLGRLPGTVVLSGMVGKIKVYILRQDATQVKPYMITVAIDQKTSFPVFLLVTDMQDRRRVYYEMNSIEYLKPHQLRDELFTIPEYKNEQRIKTPQLPSKVASGAAPAPASAGASSLPLYPGYLPKGFIVEAISKLNYVPQVEGRLVQAVVYQCDAFGPRSQLVSIFQTQTRQVNLKVNESYNREDSGFVILEKNGWVITVIGDMKKSYLMKIAEGLESNPKLVKALLEQTEARDKVIIKAMPD